MIRARPSRMPGACLVLLFALPARTLAAAAPELATEADFLEPLPVVLTVSRLPRPVSEAPAAVTVIDRDMIRASGFTEIADLLQLVPGFNVAYVRGLRQAVSYHGMADAFSRRMQVLVDGRSIYDPDFGEVRWSDLPLALDDIERIEVVRGPDAASYGANAFFAVVNIVTANPSQAQGDYASARRGSDGLYRAMYRHGGKLQDTTYRFTVSARGGSRFDNLPDDYRVGFVNAEADYRLSLSDTLQVRLGWSDGAHREGDFGDNIDPPRYRQSEAGFAQLNWHRVSDARNETSLQYYHSQYRNGDQWVIYGLSPPLDAWTINYNYDAARDDLEFQQISNPASGVRTVWGAGAREDRARSATFYGTPSQFVGDSFRAFAHAEWQASPAFLVHAGAMAERNYFTGTGVSPRIAINYFPAPGHSLRIAVTKGFRTPTFTEQKFDEQFLLGNQVVTQQGVPPASPLAAESVISREIGYLGSLRKLGLEWDLRAFHDEYRDLIGSVRVPLPPGADLLGHTRAFSFANLIDASASGAEYQLRLQPTAATRLVVGGSYVHLDATGDDEIRRSAPAHTLSVLGMHDFGAGISASFGYYRVGDMAWLGDGDPVDGYERLDLRLAKRWRLAHSNWEAALVLQNLTPPYSEFRPENVFERRNFVTLSVGF